MKWILIVTAAFAAKAATLQRPCDCAALVQETDVANKPRDCTCITGMKTYPVTPRDELKAMGPVALRKHLAKVKNEVEDLRKQKEEKEKELDEIKKTADEKIEKLENDYEKQKKDAKADKADTKSEIKKLKDKCDKQETKLQNLKNDYNKKYSEFYDLQQKLGSKMMVMAGCECKEDKEGSFLATTKGHLSPEQEQMYDQIRDVQKYEEEGKDIEDFLVDAQSQIAYHQNRGIETSEAISGRMDDHAHISHKLNFKNLLEPLQKRTDALEEAIKSEKSYVDKYEDRNKKLDTKMKALDKELKDCGC